MARLFFLSFVGKRKEGIVKKVHDSIDAMVEMMMMMNVFDGLFDIVCTTFRFILTIIWFLSCSCEQKKI